MVLQKELIERSADEPQSVDQQALADGQSLLHFLSHSEERRRIFDALADNTATPAGLAGSLPISRRTVQRTLRAFAERGLVEHEAGEYSLTTTGWLVYDTFGSAIADLGVILAHQSVFDRLPADVPLPAPEWLSDAVIVTDGGSDRPRSVERWYTRRIRETDVDVFRTVLPVVTPAASDRFRHVLDGEDAELSVVVDMADRDALRRELGSIGGMDPAAVEVFEAAGTPSIGYAVTPDRAFVRGYDEKGNVDVCIETDDPDFRRWVLENYHERQRAASRITFDGGPDLTAR